MQVDPQVLAYSDSVKLGSNVWCALNEFFGLVFMGPTSARSSLLDSACRRDITKTLALGGVLFHLLGNLLSPGGDRGRLSILIYHRALAVNDPVRQDEIDAATFERH